MKRCKGALEEEERRTEACGSIEILDLVTDSAVEDSRTFQVLPGGLENGDSLKGIAARAAIAVRFPWLEPREITRIS